MKFDDKVKTTTALAIVLIEKFPSKQELKQAQNFFGNVPFIRLGLLSNERRELKRAFRERRKQVKAMFNAFLKSPKDTSKEGAGVG